MLCDRMRAHHDLGIGIASHPEDCSRTPRTACKQLCAHVANNGPGVWRRISQSPSRSHKHRTSPSAVFCDKASTPLMTPFCCRTLSKLMRSPCNFGKNGLHGSTQRSFRVRFMLNSVCYNLRYSDVDFDNWARETKAPQALYFLAEVAWESCSIGRAGSA